MPPTRRLFRHNSPCPEPGCDGRLVKRYGQYRDMEGSTLTCSKCGEDPNVAWKVVARKKKEAAG